MAAPTGLEPVTHALTGRCSTDCATGQFLIYGFFQQKIESFHILNWHPLRIPTSYFQRERLVSYPLDEGGFLLFAPIAEHLLEQYIFLQGSPQITH